MTTARLLAGASGYSFKEWKGGFYPADMKPDAMLAWYGERLPTVEINNTFYQMPKVSVLENWAKCTPAQFRFAIKASRRITHMSRLKADSAADSVAFLYKNLAALGAKRGPVLFQLPPFMKKDLPRLSEFLRLLPEGHGAAFEFRNGRRRPLSFRARGQRAAAAGGDRALGLCAPASRELFGRRSPAVGAPARGERLARDLRVFHARADGAGLRPYADAVRRIPVR